MLIKLFDDDGNCQISLEEFQQGYLRLHRRKEMVTHLRFTSIRDTSPPTDETLPGRHTRGSRAEEAASSHAPRAYVQ